MTSDEGGGQVIDLHSRAGIRVDMASVARSQVTNARKGIGLTTSEFATILEPLLPTYPLSATLIENWESTTVPPGDVLVAVSVVSRAAQLSDASNDDLISLLVGRRFADVAAVFTSRSELSSQLPPRDLLGGAQTVDAAGLSLNLLCQQYADNELRQLVQGGATLRCLFLRPGGESIARREEEEGYPAGHLSALTAMNIQILSDRVRQQLSTDLRSRLTIATYDETIRFNLVIVDHELVVAQPYIPEQRGIESPTLLIRRQVPPGLYDVFERTYEWLWERSTPV